MTVQRRRDRRYQTALPVRARVGGRVQELVTEDVSFRGMYVLSAAPLPVRQLIRIEAALPPETRPFATHAMVVYVLGPDDPSGRAPGAGVQFYGMGDERRVWEQYIRWVQAHAEPVPDRREVPAPDRPAGSGAAAVAAPAPRSAQGSAVYRGGPGGAGDQRHYPRFPIVLEVRPRDIDDLMRLYTRDVSMGGMFLPTARGIDVGAELRLDVRHPHGDTLFSLNAVVKRTSQRPQGIGVEFTGLDDHTRREFFEFIHAPIPDVDLDDLELIEGE